MEPRRLPQRPQIQADYDALAKQTYINYMKEKQALPETMAKLGITGQGAAESTAASQSSPCSSACRAGRRSRSAPKAQRKALPGIYHRSTPPALRAAA